MTENSADQSTLQNSKCNRAHNWSDMYTFTMHIFYMEHTEWRSCITITPVEIHSTDHLNSLTKFSIIQKTMHPAQIEDHNN